AYTQDNVFNDQLKAVLPPEKVSRGGLTIDELATLLRQNHADAKAVYASETTLEKVRAEAIQNLKTPGDYVLVDFFRGELKQDMGAHWSPIAAYNEATDRFLILDVARFRYPPYWAKAEDLFRAMNTQDQDSGKSRGFVVTGAAKDAPPRVTVPPVGGRMLKFAIGAATGVFLIGALIGAVLMRIALGRRLRAAPA
ncbi:MAG: phytochelatin synthase family protein, partial [Myxococcaceae bacterium]